MKIYSLWNLGLTLGFTAATLAASNKCKKERSKVGMSAIDLKMSHLLVRRVLLLGFICGLGDTEQPDHYCM